MAAMYVLQYMLYDNVYNILYYSSTTNHIVVCGGSQYVP
jgi:hypothetical protein